MNQVSTMLEFYNDKLFDRLNRLSKPLQESFSIDMFGCIINTSDGYFTHVSNHPEIASLYLSKLCFVKCPLFSHPRNFQNDQYILTGDWNNNLFIESQSLLKERYGVYNFLNICVVDDKRASIIWFSSTKEQVSLSSIFANNLSAFKSFCRYFLEEWQPYQFKMERYYADINKFEWNIYHKENLNLDNFKCERMRDFLIKIGEIKRRLIKALSKQELECANLLTSGYSCPAIAKQLLLSPRTVESYLNHVKDKLDCYSKGELFKCLQQYQSHNLFHLLGKAD
jgi:DNA-binding CsgD family transcriptional regulator